MSELRIGSLFSGYGGLERGVQEVLGGSVAWHSEIDPGACKILAHRYPDVPNLGDITAVDWSQVEPVDVLTGGSPCQDLSAAGKRAGMRAGTRSGLWASMCDAIEIIRPGLVVWENVRGVLSAHADSAVEPCPICVGDERDAHLRALGRVVGDLSELGYVGRWVGVRASDVGGPHARYRIFVGAWPAGTNPAGLGRRPQGWNDGLRSAGLVPGSAADAGVIGRDGRPGVVGGGRDQAEWSEAGDHAGYSGGSPAADPEGQRRGEGRAEPARIVGRPDDALCGDADAADSDFPGLEGAEPAPGHELPAWGPYGDAVRRWERVTRPAPAPTELSAKGSPRLSPAFVEWMMGLPAGWVTEVPGLSRNEQLKALGNGVVPQQAAHALRLMLGDVQAVAA